jgi:hypothetical protein
MGVRVALPGARTDVTIAMPGGPIDALLTMVPRPTMAMARALALAGMGTVAPATAMAAMAGMVTVALALDSVSASDADFYFKPRPRIVPGAIAVPIGIARVRRDASDAWPRNFCDIVFRFSTRGLSLFFCALATDNGQQDLRGLCRRVEDCVLPNLVGEIDMFEYKISDGEVAVGKLQSDPTALFEQISCRHHRHFEPIGRA